MSKQPSGSGLTNAEIIVDHRQVLAGIREFFQTPAEMRGDVQSMSSLARHLGCNERDLHRVMSMNPDMGSDILQSVALAGSIQIPRVLYKLMEAIEAGSIKAAEIYLDFIRKTIQDERFQTMAASASADLTKVLGNVGSQVDMLLQAAEQRTPEEARAHLSSVVTHTPEGFAARSAVALEADRTIPKASMIEEQV